MDRKIGGEINENKQNYINTDTHECIDTYAMKLESPKLWQEQNKFVSSMANLE